MGLEVRDVRAGYGRVEVLHGVDVTIPAGATVAVVGPNGAGKSTLLRCIAGLLPVRSGIVEWSGRDITNRSAYDRAADGMVLVPDGHNVFTALTVRENLTLFSQGEQFDAAIDAFPALAGLLERRAGTLSGGERQMVALSHPLLRSARFVLLDEASRGLSPGAADRFYDRIAGLRAPDRSLVIVEQYLDGALRLADIAYRMRRGEVVYSGDPRGAAGSPRPHAASGHKRERPHGV